MNYRMFTLADRLDSQSEVIAPRAVSALFVGLGSLALLLAAVGLYGVPIADFFNLKFSDS